MSNSFAADSGLTNGTTLDPSVVRVNPGNYDYIKPIEFAGNTYDLLNKAADLEGFITVTKEMLAYLEDQSRPLPKNFPLYLDKKTQDKMKISKKNTARALKEISKLAKISLEYINKSDRSQQEELDRKDAIVHILELNSSLNMKLRRPIEDMNVPEVVKTIKEGLKKEHYGILASKPATNLESTGEKDLSKVNPMDSTFWKKTTDIGSKELFYGFNRKEMVTTKDQVCKYSEAKRSFGSHAGFAIMCGDYEVKVKFSDFHTEPFNSRMFWSLGFDTQATDYAKGFKLEYDRRIFTEINERKKIISKIKLPSVIPDVKLDMITKQVDAFKFIKAAKLKDGSTIDREGLRKLITKKMKDWDYKHLKDSDFLPDGESKIEYLEFVQAQFQHDSDNEHSIGPWESNELAHDDRREMRGMAILGGWLNMTSMRFDDARLYMVKKNDTYELLHRFNELGTGLGQAKNLLNQSATNPNELPWKFTTKATGADGKPSIELLEYKPVTDISAFDKLTVDDAKWMARLIAQLSEDQIKTILIASGMHSEYVKLYLEKLISRRDGLIKDLGLDSEFQVYRKKLNKTFNYDPKKDGLMSVTLFDGQTVTAPAGPGVIVNGVLESPELNEEK